MSPEVCKKFLLVELGISQAQCEAMARHAETFAAAIEDHSPRVADYLRKRARFWKQMGNDTAALRDEVAKQEA